MKYIFKRIKFLRIYFYCMCSSLSLAWNFTQEGWTSWPVNFQESACLGSQFDIPGMGCHAWIFAFSFLC